MSRHGEQETRQGLRSWMSQNLKMVPKRRRVPRLGTPSLSGLADVPYFPEPASDPARNLGPCVCNFEPEPELEVELVALGPFDRTRRLGSVGRSRSACHIIVKFKSSAFEVEP